MKNLKSSDTNPSILIVEDDPTIQKLLVSVLVDTGAQLRAVTSAQEGLISIAERPWSLLITDVNTPGAIDGIELAWIVSKEYPTTEIIVTSGCYDNGSKGLPQGALFMLKPWRLNDLMAAINKKLYKNTLVSSREDQ